MAKKILGISGSPRKNGNTEKMINYVLSSAPELDYEFETVRLYELDIKPCTACDACKKNGGKCIIKDDLVLLTEKIKSSEILVFGTPVYWWGPSAGFKLFMDRWYANGLSASLKGKKIIIVIPLEDTNKKTASYTAGIFKNALDYIGADLVDITISTGTCNPGDIDSKIKTVDKLKNILSKVIK
jgi:multimeric flavodoxin WrbA